MSELEQIKARMPRFAKLLKVDNETYTLRADLFSEGCLFETIYDGSMDDFMQGKFRHLMLIRSSDGKIVHSAALMIFNDKKQFSKNQMDCLFWEADDFSAELSDAVLLAKSIYQKLKLTAEELAEKPIIVIPQYWSEDGDSVDNLVLTDMILRGKDEKDLPQKTYSALALNLTPLRDYSFNYYYGDDLSIPQKQLDQAHEYALKAGCKELDFKDPTRYTVSRYVIDYGMKNNIQKGRKNNE